MFYKNYFQAGVGETAAVGRAGQEGGEGIGGGGVGGGSCRDSWAAAAVTAVAVHNVLSCWSVRLDSCWSAVSAVRDNLGKLALCRAVLVPAPRPPHHDHLLPAGRGLLHRGRLHQAPLQVEGRIIVAHLIKIIFMNGKTSADWFYECFDSYQISSGIANFTYFKFC